MQSTIELFEHLYNHLPPLFPAEVALEMKNELEDMVPISASAEIADPRFSTKENRDKSSMNVRKIENTMIKFGYDIWPWNQAYKHFLDVARDQLGEHFLLPQMSEGLHEKYLDFKAFNGELKDLQTGRAASFFTPEERAELCGELVNMQVQLKDYVNRDLVGVNQKKYFNKIEEYEKLLGEIKFHLTALWNLAWQEEKDSVLFGEINSKIRDFEHSLCSLGTELDYDAVCAAPDFFAGRKIELSRLRGIHIPMQIDFFNS